jgi:type IV secretion system protein VirB4
MIPRHQRSLSKRLSAGAAALTDMSASQHLPFAYFRDGKTLVLKGGGMLQMIRLRGMPYDTCDIAELDAAKNGRQNVLRIIADPRVSLWFTVIRRAVREYPAGHPTPDFARMVNDRWRAKWADKTFYVNDLYLSVIRAPQEKAGGLRSWLSASADAAADIATHEALDELVTEVVGGLRSYGAEVLSLSARNGVIHAPQLAVLRFILNGYQGASAAPLGPVDGALQTAVLDFERRTRAGQPFAMLGIREYPPMTVAGMLDELLSLPFEMVVTQSFRYAPRDKAVEEMRRQHRRYELVGDAAVSLQNELAEAQDRVASRKMAWGLHHLSVLIQDVSEVRLKEGAAEAISAMNALGISATREHLGLEPSFWAQFPGNAAYICRSGGISTENLAAFASLHAHPRGKLEGNHWGPAITAFQTASGGPYFFNFHDGDIGNTVVVGRSGSGKTVAAGFLLSQATRVPGLRTFVFDRDRANEITVRALGGNYSSVRSEARTGWNPFALPDTVGNRAFLKELMVLLATADHAQLTPREYSEVTAVVDEIYRIDDPAARRLREACGFLPHTSDGSVSLVDRLAPWHSDGARAWVFDNADDQMELSGQHNGFDMTLLLSDPVLSQPALAYVFHRVTNALDGTPTIIYVDEGWHFLSHPIFEKRITEWLRTIRKLNGIFILVTQSASDALNSKVGQMLIEQCPTKLFFPIRSGNKKDFCDGWGLSERQFELLRELGDNSRSFLVVKGDGSVVVRLDLGGEPDIIAVLSARATSLEMLDSIRTRAGDDYAAWAPRFFSEVQDA